MNRLHVCQRLCVIDSSSSMVLDAAPEIDYQRHRQRRSQKIISGSLGISGGDCWNLGSIILLLSVS